MAMFATGVPYRAENLVTGTRRDPMVAAHRPGFEYTNDLVEVVEQLLDDHVDTFGTLTDGPHRGRRGAEVISEYRQRWQFGLYDYASEILRDKLRGALA